MPPLFQMRRDPFLYLLGVGGVLLLHAFLCYPAAVSRGYPPMSPFDLVAPFLAPAGMLLPPFFDDLQNFPRPRLLRSAFVAAGFCFIWGVVSTNVTDARPHIGHLAGVVGVFKSYSPFIVVWTIFYLPTATLFFYCLDGVAIGFWSLVRGFSKDVTRDWPDIRQH